MEEDLLGEADDLEMEGGLVDDLGECSDLHGTGVVYVVGVARSSRLFVVGNMGGGEGVV